MNAAGLSKKSNDTLQHHVIKVASPPQPTSLPVTSEAPAHASSMTSSAVTTRAGDVIVELGHQEVPAYYDDINIPSDSYFTGDEEIPVWNVPDNAPLLDAATDDNDHKITTLASQQLTQSAPSYTGNGNSRDVICLHKLTTSPVVAVTSHVTSADAGYHDDSQASLRRTDLVSAYRLTTTTQHQSYAPLTTTQLQSHAPLRTTSSPQGQLISRLLATTTTPPQQFSSPTHSTTSRDQSTLRDVTTMTLTAVQDIGNLSSPSYTAGSSRSDVQKAAAAATQQRQQAAAAAGRPVRAGQLGGFGTWHRRRSGSDYFDFFDYIVDYQTPRPPLGRLRPKRLSRRQKKVKSRRVKDGRSNLADVIYTWPPQSTSGAVDQLDVVGQSHGVDFTDARSRGRRGGSHHQGLPLSAPGWIVTDQPRHRRKSLKIRGNSAIHLSTTVNQNLKPTASGVRFLKEGKRELKTVQNSSTESAEPLR